MAKYIKTEEGYKTITDLKIADRDDFLNAQGMANAAYAKASTAQSTADEALTSANTAQADVNKTKIVANDNATKLMTLKTISGTLPDSCKWYSIIYGNGKFVAVGGHTNGNSYYNDIVYSEDGVNWEKANHPHNVFDPNISYYSSVAFGGGKFVAANHNGYDCAYSEDGIKWTSLHGNCSIDTVVYGNDKFVGIDSGSRSIYYSEDGVMWSSLDMDIGFRFKSITYGNGRFVAVGQYYNRDFTTYSMLTAVSEDGVTWQESHNILNNWNGEVDHTDIELTITYGDGKFVCIALDSYTYNHVYYIEDKDISKNSNSYWYESRYHINYTNGLYNYCNLIYSANIFVAIFGTKGVYYSYDGIDWVSTFNNVNTIWTTVNYCKDKFIAIGYDTTSANSVDNITAYSEDGINWYTEYERIYQNNNDVTDQVASVLDYITSEEVDALSASII